MSPSNVGLRLNVPRRVRQVVGPWLNRLARTLGQPDYHVRRTEYVGTVHVSIDDLEAHLQRGGFTWAPFSLYHRTPTETSTDGSWTYRPWLLADRQLHVILFTQSSDRTDVYAHNEYNWLCHPYKHAKRKAVRRKEGAEQMRRWLDAQGLAYDHESVVPQKAVHLYERLREYLSNRDTLRQ